MICPPCRAAAQWLQDIKRPVTDREEAARYDHARCEAPATCPCQHEIVTPKRILAKRK